VGHGHKRCFSKGKELPADELFALFAVPGVGMCSGGKAGGGKPRVDTRDALDERFWIHPAAGKGVC
jgi:hypothetical protein